MILVYLMTGAFVGIFTMSLMFMARDPHDHEDHND